MVSYVSDIPGLPCFGQAKGVALTGFTERADSSLGDVSCIGGTGRSSMALIEFQSSGKREYCRLKDFECLIKLGKKDLILRYDRGGIYP